MILRAEASSSESQLLTAHGVRVLRLNRAYDVGASGL